MLSRAVTLASARSQRSYEEDLSIRPANKQDMTAICGIISSSADWYRPFVAKADMSEHLVDLAWAEKNFQMRKFYVGVDQKGKVQGTITMQHFGDWVYLGYIYLHTSAVGRGYGAQLIDHAREQSLAAGAKGMVLIAHPQAKWAKRAYLKYGFKIISRDKNEILAWNQGALRPHYEEGFELYRYDLKSMRTPLS